MKKLVLWIVIFSVVLDVYILLNMQYTTNNFNRISNIVTGFAGESVGLVGLVILGPELIINISSPENKTYEFPDIMPYEINLNVSANGPIDIWWYELLDTRHNRIVYSNIGFSPNTTFNAVRFNNKLTVFAQDSTNRIANASVEFYVNVTQNHAPILGPIQPEVFICENQQLDYKINATDSDEDSMLFSINNPDPFFIPNNIPILSYIFNGIYYVSFAETSIVSRLITKSVVQGNLNYTENISVTDGNYVDSNLTIITIIEINNNPEFSRIGAQTVWTHGENSSFYRQLDVRDIESGNDHASGRFSYKLDFLSDSTGPRFFDINRTGGMNFSGNNTLVGNYHVNVSVTDQALPDNRIHSRIEEFCGQDGKNRTTSEDFWITVTNENRPPIITSYYPRNLSFSALGTDNLYFNITTFDPDDYPDTYPDALWYVDDFLKQIDSHSEFVEFRHNFGCGVGGLHKIRVDVTDGLLNATLQWNVSLENVVCSAGNIGGPGGGGGPTGGCNSLWACNDWQVCENTENALQIGSLVGEFYRKISAGCAENYWTGEKCGYQNRECFDLNSCNKTIGKPELTQACWYTKNPTCQDGIKNCHDGSCEFLLDCGGPCGACPTCSDGKQNQGEEKIDCGGPCPNKCPVEIPLDIQIKSYSWVLILLIFLLILALIVWRVWKRRREVKGV